MYIRLLSRTYGSARDLTSLSRSQLDKTREDAGADGQTLEGSLRQNTDLEGRCMSHNKWSITHRYIKM